MGIDREHQNYRRRTILEILAEKPMKRQLDIGRALRRMGFKVTQATVSRDLEALGIVRREGYYRPPQARGDQSQIAQMQSFIRHVRGAGPHMVVLETTVGAAKAVAAALRSANWPEVRGIVAEEETILVVTDNVYDSRVLLQRMRRILGK
jgi:transcriptional regulator of arginine metabolism